MERERSLTRPCYCLRTQSFGFRMLPHLLAVKATLTNVQVNLRLSWQLHVRLLARRLLGR